MINHLCYVKEEDEGFEICNQKEAKYEFTYEGIKLYKRNTLSSENNLVAVGVMPFINFCKKLKVAIPGFLKEREMSVSLDQIKVKRRKKVKIVDAWVHLLDNQPEAQLSDNQLREAMYELFPDKKGKTTIERVSMVRACYNKGTGMFANFGPSEVPVFQYDDEGNKVLPRRHSTCALRTGLAKEPSPKPEPKQKKKPSTKKKTAKKKVVRKKKTSTKKNPAKKKTTKKKVVRKPSTKKKTAKKKVVRKKKTSTKKVASEVVSE